MLNNVTHTALASSSSKKTVIPPFLFVAGHMMFSNSIHMISPDKGNKEKKQVSKIIIFPGQDSCGEFYHQLQS